ncbi:MAG: hypothetical protein AB1480_03250 [Nitrospirota bacterium]
MPKIVDFVVVFDDGVRKRHYHETEKGKVTYFAVQLEIEVKGEWKVVVRYGCSHGFSHIDKYDIRGNKTKEILNLSFESALTYGDWDINKNWLKFLKGAR